MTSSSSRPITRCTYSGLRIGRPLGVYAVVMVLVARVVGVANSARCRIPAEDSRGPPALRPVGAVVRELPTPKLLGTIVNSVKEAFDLEGAALLLPFNGGSGGSGLCWGPAVEPRDPKPVCQHRLARQPRACSARRRKRRPSGRRSRRYRRGSWPDGAARCSEFQGLNKSSYEPSPTTLPLPWRGPGSAMTPSGHVCWKRSTAFGVRWLAPCLMTCARRSRP